MPKEVRTSSRSQHKSRTQPYPAKPLASTSTPSPELRLPATSSAARPTDAKVKMESMSSSPSSHEAQMAMNVGYGITSPGTERASTAWTEEDDTRLMLLRSKNMNWIAIAQHFHNKTGNACRKRHERLVEKRQAQGWDNVRLSDLATAYMDCRQTMWQLLADRVGEQKWQTIEQKCMEKGFKTLSSAARAQKRHSPLGLHHPHDSLEASSDHYVEPEVMVQAPFRDSGYYEPGTLAALSKEQLSQPSLSYQYHFGSQPGNNSFLSYAPPTAVHSRRASAAHSIGPQSVDQHSSRSNSHGPVVSMAPPAATNPFASPQPYYQDPMIAPQLQNNVHSPATYPGTGHRPLSAHQQTLPSITNGFDSAMGQRLPSIIGTQG